MPKPKTSYVCEKCQYHTYKKSNYVNHCNRKTLCTMPLQIEVTENVSSNVSSNVSIVSQQQLSNDQCTKFDVTCPFCNRLFKHRSSKSRHIKLCNKRFDSERDIQVNDLHQELLALRRELQTQKQNNGGVGSATFINHINNGVINNNNITINAFGKEDLAYITDHPNFQRFMAKCIKQTTHGVCEYMIKKHFHPDHPENHNIRKLNRKDNFIEYYDGNAWKIHFCEEMFREIFSSIEADFRAFMETASSSLREDNGLLKTRWFENFVEKVGVPLDWDLGIDDLNTPDEMNEQKKGELKTKIYKLACEYIYRHSKTITELSGKE